MEQPPVSAPSANETNSPTTPSTSRRNHHSARLNNPNIPPSSSNIASIFQYKVWKRASRIRLVETAPLSLFWHADEYLSRTIKILHRVRDPASAQFRNKCENVHRAQRMVLDSVFLTYRDCDPSIRADRAYRNRLPPEDQRELDGRFSENILFAAQALARGFRIRGIEAFTAELTQPARNLCASIEALRFVFRTRATNKGTSPPYTDLEPVLTDFDRAWAAFEQHICFCYFAVTYSGRPASDDETEMFEVLMSETIVRALETRLIEQSQLAELDPSVIFAVPRLTIIAGLIHTPEAVTMTDAETSFRWFKSKAATLKHVQSELRRMGPKGIQLLEKMLVLGCDYINDYDELDICGCANDAGICEGNNKTANSTTPLPLVTDTDVEMALQQEPAAPVKRPDHLRIWTRQDPKLSSTGSSLHLSPAAEVSTANSNTTFCQTPPHGASATMTKQEFGSSTPIKNTQELIHLCRESPRDQTFPHESSRRSSAQTALLDTQQIRHEITRESLQKLFTAVCSVADDLQSGSKAKEFVEILHRVFAMHGEVSARI
ncbi:hypothetical protein SeMB42_g01834 [Synchytrium endobioticum]|uniref:Uncharacterized protein n=1 Tax=Synchytrium endobioticum TaxID=286115 RepID=A0A507DJ66_9FUNG|nr:hypothetical protein SeLEV6574_g00430 [Synchytrium endobioticum]TPX51653.1 hypothetical protein SeMB42_g01834 [Synchytrium endobioticum]